MAIVVDVSREALSEDCRGGFDPAGNATHVSRLQACCVAARALASGADAVCVFPTDASASENGRSETRPNRALCIATTAGEARLALSGLERAVGLARATDDGGSSSHRPPELPPMGTPKGAPFATALSLATMALRRMAAASPPNVADEATFSTPRRSILALLASDGAGRSSVEAIEAAMDKLRAFDADAKCHVLRVAPNVGDEAGLAEAAAAATRCAACAAAARERRDRKPSREESDARVPFVARRTDTTLSGFRVRNDDPRDTPRSCSCCGTSLTRTKNIVWSATGFGKAHAARAALRRRVFGGDDRLCDEDHSRRTFADATATATASSATSAPTSASSSLLGAHIPSTRAGTVDRLACAAEHVHALELLSDGATAEIEARVERAERESATMAVETVRTVTAESDSAEHPRALNLRVERQTAFFDAIDVRATVAALTSPIASVRVGRLLETRARETKLCLDTPRRETLALVPERRLGRSAFDERLELWLRVDGALVVAHARDERRTDTVARIGAHSADALRRLAAARRELTRRRAGGETMTTSTGELEANSSSRAPHLSTNALVAFPLPNDASGRAFQLVTGTGAGSRASYFWLRDANVDDGARTLARFAEKMADPPTLSASSGVPAERLAALAPAAAALAEAATRGQASRFFDRSESHGFATLVRDVVRLEAERARREDAEARRRRAEGWRAAKTKSRDKEQRIRASSRETSPSEAHARAAVIATRVFGEPAASLLPDELEPGTERTTASELARGARAPVAAAPPSVARRVATRRPPFARAKTASSQLAPGARVTATNVASLFATEAGEEEEEAEHRESDDETRERERV